MSDNKIDLTNSTIRFFYIPINTDSVNYFKNNTIFKAETIDDNEIFWSDNTKGNYIELDIHTKTFKLYNQVLIGTKITTIDEFKLFLLEKGNMFQESKSQLQTNIPDTKTESTIIYSTTDMDKVPIKPVDMNLYLCEIEHRNYNKSNIYCSAKHYGDCEQKIKSQLLTSEFSGYYLLGITCIGSTKYNRKPNENLLIL